MAPPAPSCTADLTDTTDSEDDAGAVAAENVNVEATLVLVLVVVEISSTVLGVHAVVHSVSYGLRTITYSRRGTG